MFKVVTFCIAILLSLSGCNVSDSGVLKEDPFINGEITQWREGKVYHSILVEENPNISEPLEPGGTKIWLTITNKTNIYSRTEDRLFNKSNIEKLKNGQKVEAWVNGPVADSYPLQGAADQIVVIQE